jgi:hypothetical protein
MINIAQTVLGEDTMLGHIGIEVQTEIGMEVGIIRGKASKVLSTTCNSSRTTNCNISTVKALIQIIGYIHDDGRVCIIRISYSVHGCLPCGCSLNQRVPISF